MNARSARTIDRRTATSVRRAPDSSNSKPRCGRSEWRHFRQVRLLLRYQALFQLPRTLAFRRFP
jgi:hypothetical protein